MKIHYFQRYHEKENVATANTMLLLSRFYSYSPDKFFRFLKSHYFTDSFSPEIVFDLQRKSEASIPDAVISQDSFKIVVETKMSDWFYGDQLMKHLTSFGDENYKVLLTLAPEPMDPNKKKEFDRKLIEYNAHNNQSIVHKNTTFEDIANAINEELTDQDIEILDVLEDFRSYCYEDGLIPNFDSWKYMRVQLAGQTFDFNTKENVYYDNAERGFRAHEFLGLYTNKSVRAVGKVVAYMTAIETDKGVVYNAELGEVTDERKRIIEKAMLDGDSHGYPLRTIKHRYFFVEKFFQTDFKKITPRAPRGTRIFNLSQILEIDEPGKMKSTEEIAEILKTKTWE